MKAKIARWGNSLALRLPAEVVRDFGLKEGQVVDLSPNKPTIEIKTERPRTSEGIPIYTLEELVAEMKRLGPENRPAMRASTPGSLSTITARVCRLTGSTRATPG